MSVALYINILLMPNFLTYYNDHSASIYSQELSKKDILNIIKRKGVDILGSVRRARILEVYFPAGAKYIFNIGENENSIGEM